MIPFPEESPMQPDEETGRLFLHLKAAQGVMRMALTDALSDIGITVPQLLILRGIEITPAISSAQLARECFVSPQAMVANIARLCSGRTIETHLTDKGRAIYDRAGSRIQSAERYVTQMLGEDTVRALDRGLRELADCMQKSVVVTTSRSWDTDEEA